MLCTMLASHNTVPMRCEYNTSVFFLDNILESRDKVFASVNVHPCGWFI